MRALALLALASVASAGDARDEAWFAFRAAEQGDRNAVPRLVEALAKEPDARRWVLDALIRLEGEVPAEGVVGLFKEFPDEALVLLARDPEKHEAQLAAVAEAASARNRHLHWVAACNLLAARKSKLLAPHILRDLELELAISLSDSDALGGGEGERGPGWSRAVDLAPGDPQWPPIPTYALTDQQGGASVPVAPGRKTIYCVRKVAQPTDKRTRFRRSDRAERWHAQRVGYLADLAGVSPSKLGLCARHHATVVWRGTESYPADMAAARERVEGAYRDIVAKLVEAQLVDPLKAPKAPLMKVTVTDRRTDKSVALPALDGVEMKPE